jgi:hypothetical protein
MDRTILFRGKAILSSDFVYGDLLAHRAPQEICVDNNAIAVERGTVDQYLGFRDKNQFFVFDRDILAVEGYKHPFLVQHMDNWCGCYLFPIEGETILWKKPMSVRRAKRNGIDIVAFGDSKNIEIVGNRHNFNDAMIKFDVWLGKQQAKYG